MGLLPLSTSYKESIDSAENDRALSLSNTHITVSNQGINNSSAFSVKSYGSVFDPKSPSIMSIETPTPLPRMQMFALFFILISEPLTSTILFPFIYYMIRDFNISDDEKEIGSYAGWITSVFFIAQFFTVFTWGKMSEIYGRRPVLLIGMIGNTISTCLFGLSKSLWWAIGCRILCGVMNGNTAVGRNVIAEITDHTNRAMAFSLWGFCFGLGFIAGPAIGGYFCNPVESLPSIFGNSVFFKTYPYSLPCFVSAALTGIGFIIAYFFLEESNAALIARKNLMKDANPLLDEPQVTESILTSIRNISKPSRAVITSFCLYAFHAMMFDEVTPLYFTAPSYAGGLDIPPQAFAKILSALGLTQIVFQFLIYPHLASRFSVLSLYRFAGLAFVPVYFLYPEITTWKHWLELNVADENVRYWFFACGYMLLLCLRVSFSGTCFTSMSILLSTSATPETMSTISSACQSCLCFVRGIAPTVGGTLWSISLRDGNRYPFNYHLVFYLGIVLTLINTFYSQYIPASLSIGGRRHKA